MADAQRGVAKEQHWREVLAQQAASGLSARAFCRRENLTESAFYFWRRTIRVRDGLSGPPAKSRRALSESRAAFVAVTVSGTARSEGSILLELAGGRVLRLPPSTSTATLVELVIGLEAARRSP
jgi:transposase-like protein